VGAGDGCGLTACDVGGWRRHRHAGPSRQRQREGGGHGGGCQLARVGRRLAGPRDVGGCGEQGRKPSWAGWAGAEELGQQARMRKGGGEKKKAFFFLFSRVLTNHFQIYFQMSFESF